MKTIFCGLAGTAIAALALPSAATAQSQPQQRSLAQIVVFGTDPCPRSTDDEVVVCARKPESERFRIPEELREDPSRQKSQSWAANARYLESVNQSGIQHQCSPVGEAGFTGCLSEIIEQGSEVRRELERDETPPE